MWAGDSLISWDCAGVEKEVQQHVKRLSKWLYNEITNHDLSWELSEQDVITAFIEVYENTVDKKRIKLIKKLAKII